MIKHTIEISQEPVHLAVRLGQLTLQRNQQVIASIPCEDIGVVVVDQPATTYSHHALVSLAESEAVLIVCGRDHLPAAVLLPIAQNSQLVSRLAIQIESSKPLRKKLWRQLVRAKIRAQAVNLDSGSPTRRKLLDLIALVRSGDPTNVEAQAARLYWGKWLAGREFRRNDESDPINGMLNYGYAIMRAAVARAIVSAGLMPSLGLAHCNRSNAFCLADDLMEPLRPLVDARVRALSLDGRTQVDQPCKAALLEVLSQRVRMGNETGPLMVNLHRMVASLMRCLAGEADRLEVPQSCS